MDSQAQDRLREEPAAFYMKASLRFLCLGLKTAGVEVWAFAKQMMPGASEDQLSAYCEGIAEELKDLAGEEVARWAASLLIEALGETEDTCKYTVLDVRTGLSGMVVASTHPTTIDQLAFVFESAEESGEGPTERSQVN